MQYGDEHPTTADYAWDAAQRNRRDSQAITMRLDRIEFKLAELAAEVEALKGASRDERAD